MQTVALLGRADGALQSLRRALEELGAQVVFEGDPAAVEAEQVLRSGAQTVLVNLASGVEDDIDHLETLFDDPNVNVVFNEAEVSSQLEGWDLARWARHLAAKVMGHERTIPPPPPGAELLPMRNYMPSPGAPPTPAQMAVQRPIEEFMIEAEDRVDAVPSDHLPYASGGKRAPLAEEPEPDFSIDVGEVEGALAQLGGATALEQRAVPEPVVPEILVHEDDAAEFDVGLDLAALDAALQIDTRPPPAASGKSDAALLEEALAGFNLDFDSNAGEGGEDAESITLESVALSSDGLELDESSGESLLDDDVAAMAAQLDAMDAAAPRSQVQDLDFSDYSDKPDASAERPAPAAPAREKAPSRPAPAPAPIPAAAPAAAEKKPSFGALDLAPMSDDVPAAPAAPAAPKPSGGYDFSHLNLSLEPTEDEPATVKAAAPPATPPKPGGYDFSGLDLSLEAVEEEPGSAMPQAAATTPAQASASEPNGLDALFAAMDLAPSRPAAAPAGASASAGASPDTLRRVIVLGASIGGPDALRSFLGGIPENFPALFVLAQHLENGFFERLAQQLQKSSRLPVRVPEAGQRGVPGEVLVIPGKQRVQLELDGTIQMVEHDHLPKYTPCIDDVLRDVADTFGSSATAIIFSGMAGDAIEGAVHLTSQGGEVWAQDPASCVVSSMVDGARARGVVEFVGSPRELAERCVAQYGNG